MLVVRDRSGACADQIVQALDTAHLAAVLQPVLSTDAVLCTDGSAALAAAARHIGMEHHDSEVFGHEAGSFTGAQKRRIGKIEHANNGTLFLDEIENMPLAMQVKFLRVLQERNLERLGSNEIVPVSFRVVAATKESLRKLSDEGKFRSDLYYRLNVVTIDTAQVDGGRLAWQCAGTTELC